MKVLLDEMLPISVRELLSNHEVVTAAYAGLAGIPNGATIDGAVSQGFDLIVSLDRGIPFQQSLAGRPIALVLIPDNDVDRIRPYADDLRNAVAGARPGAVVRVARR